MMVTVDGPRRCRRAVGGGARPRLWGCGVDGAGAGDGWLAHEQPGGADDADELACLRGADHFVGAWHLGDRARSCEQPRPLTLLPRREPRQVLAHHCLPVRFLGGDLGLGAMRAWLITRNRFGLNRIPLTRRTAPPPGPRRIVGTIAIDTEPDTGFGVDMGENDWAALGLVTSLRKARLSRHRRRIDVQALTDVNNMLFKILATPDR
jgi:hypothetical protein